MAENSGYITVQELIPLDLVDKILSKKSKLYPVRASSSKKQYAEKDEIKTLPDISVWWSQSTMDWEEVIEIEKTINPIITKFNSKLIWYESSIVTIEPNSDWVNPHVDTPHRFSKWNTNPELLGIQCIVALEDTTPLNGATGVVPGSQLQSWDITKCYSGEYDTYFNLHYIQPLMPKGTILVYESRLLHSSMPNYSTLSRPALLLNFIDRDIIEDVRRIDNVWESNQKEEK